MMKLCVVLCAVLLPYLAAALPAKSPGRLGEIWKDCGQSGDVVKINSLKIFPDPPQIGKMVSIGGNITTSAAITGGSVEIKIKFGIFPVPGQKEDFCDLLKAANLSCPLAAGTYTMTQNATVPSDAPKGHYTGNVKGTDQNGNELFCIDIDAHLG